jgi:hypothetical protein
MLKKLSTIVATSVCAAAFLTISGVTSAQDPAYLKRTLYTFSGPFELPGVTLQPGQYEFRLANPDSGRTMIQVSSVDGKQIYGTFFTMPLQADRPAAQAEVRFMESAAGAPAAVRAVWYVGESMGREFIYPREQAMRLAKNTKQPVLTTAGVSTKADETQTGTLSRVGASGQDSAPSSSNAAANQSPAPSSSTSASASSANRTVDADRPAQSPVAGGTATTTRDRTAAARSELPRTASGIPALGMLGFAVLGVAAALRLWSLAAQR